MTERILGHQLFYSAESILAFAGCGSEISTSEIIKEALRLGKKVYLPKVQGENMSFFRIFFCGESWLPVTKQFWNRRWIRKSMSMQKRRLKGH